MGREDNDGGLWKSKFPWKPGFKVFYSPVYLKPQIVIVGHNPGGGEQAFIEDRQKFEHGNFSLPLCHEYISKNYPIAKKMRDFLRVISNYWKQV